jgi:hypothetical protein
VDTTGNLKQNWISFDEGLDRIKQACDEAGLTIEKRVVTSREQAAVAAMDALQVKNVPDGFQKWQLPVSFSGASQLFLTTAAPGAHAAPHSHPGDGIRFIAGGSIHFEGQELTAGDWMFIPADVEYSFTTGRYGAVMCYCYCCCCVPREQ